MQYQIPQFIEIEDKIIGPFTFRQFVYLAGGAGLSYVIYAVAAQILLLPFFIAIVLPVPAMLLALALAFYKVNNRPFIFALESAVKYYTGGKLYLWKKETREATKSDASGTASSAGLLVPTISGSKLREIGWNLDIKSGSKNSVEEGIGNSDIRLPQQ